MLIYICCDSLIQILIVIWIFSVINGDATNFIALPLQTSVTLFTKKNNLNIYLLVIEVAPIKFIVT